jgi:hypothetical protein
MAKKKRAVRNYAEEKLRRDTFVKIPVTGGGVRYFRK